MKKKYETAFDECRIVLLGGGGVGKSNTMVQYCQKTFVEDYDPTFMDNSRKNVAIDERTIMLDILDTYGYEEYIAMKEQYLRSGQAFIVVCSVTDKHSIHNIREQIQQLLRVKESTEMPIIFALNKIDLLSEKEYSQTIHQNTLQIDQIIQDFYLLNTHIMETSAKTGHNIDALFEHLVRQFRNGTVDPIELLTQIIKKDVKYLDEYQKKTQEKQKCVTM